MLRLFAAALVLSLAVGARAADLDMRHLALGWASGDYRAPILCEIDGQPRRALRRIVIRPASELRSGTEPLAAIQLFDLEAPPGTHCHDELGDEEPNLVGILTVTLQATPHPDTAARDFQFQLRREHGFRFEVRRSQLRGGEPGVPIAKLAPLDFKGGSADMREVPPGSDSWRRLEELGANPKRSLVLAAPDGRELRFDLIQVSGPAR